MNSLAGRFAYGACGVSRRLECMENCMRPSPRYMIFVHAISCGNLSMSRPIIEDLKCPAFKGRGIFPWTDHGASLIFRLKGTHGR
jgi:hypothetical protein